MDNYVFYPPYDPPKTREEFIACHRAYWNFIFENRLTDKPKIISRIPVETSCYGCMFMRKWASILSETSGKCVDVCPLRDACDVFTEEFYEKGASAAKKIAEAEWDFSKIDEYIEKYNVDHNRAFVPPYLNPQTEEEFEACHRAYWNFIADNLYWYKPAIISNVSIIHACYGCTFSAKLSPTQKPDCTLCPLKDACKMYLKEFYSTKDIGEIARIAREAAVGWKFTTRTQIHLL